MPPTETEDQLDVVAVATAVVQELMGTGATPGPLSSSVERQVMDQVEMKVAKLGLVDSINEIREQIASRAPAASKGLEYPPPPWARAGAYARGALGVPDPSWHNPDAIGAQEDGVWESPLEFMRAVVIAGRSGQRDERLNFVTSGSNMSAAMTGQEIELGGALVPEEFRPQLMMMNLQPTSIRPRAMVLPMAAPTIQIPAIRDSSHRENVFGGVEFQWLEVNAAPDESEPDFKLIELTARSLAGRTLIPNTLIQDSFISVPALIYRLWGEAVPWIEEKHFLRGDGVAKPAGVLNSEAAITSPRKTADAIEWEDIAEMESRLLPGSDGRAVWMAHPAAKAQLMQLRNGEVNAYMSPREGDPATLVGRPLVYNEHMSPRDVDGQVALIDWSYYLIGDRQALSMEASAHEQFSNFITVLRGISRLDGQPWLDTPLTAAQRLDDTGTDDFTMSPFVLLEGK